MSNSITHWDGDSWRFSEFHRRDTPSRAILVCGGPSLSLLDTSKLKGPGKTVLGMNTTYPHVIPDMWIGMDDIRCYDRNVLFEPFPKFLRGSFSKMKCQGSLVKELPNVHFINVKTIEQRQELWNHIKPSADTLIWTRNTLAVSVNLLMSMGFKEIYLAGCDLNNEDTDYFDDRELKENEQSKNKRLYGEIYRWLEWLVPRARKRGTYIFSLSEGGKINDFMPYITIDDLNKRVSRDLFTPAPWHNAHSLQDLVKEDKIKKEYIL